MKKYLLLLLFAITVLFVLSGCGNKREIDDDTVVSYLEESYFAERGLSIDELSDITESEAESAQKRNLTCTTKASGELCSQTANWTITFEKLSDEWVGIENEMGASDLILNEPSESYILGLVGTIAQDKINYWYYHLENFSVDTDSSEMELTVRVYINHKYYVEAIDYLFLYRWNAYSLSWSKVNDGEFMNSFVILKYDISGNYDTKDYGVVTISNSEGEYYVSTSGLFRPRPVDLPDRYAEAVGRHRGRFPLRCGQQRSAGLLVRGTASGGGGAPRLHLAGRECPRRPCAGYAPHGRGLRHGY